MQIGVVREVAPGEQRVALVPETVEKLVRQGVSVSIEAGAGSGAYISDAQYGQAGATIAADARAVYGSADLVIGIHRPMDHPALGAHQADLLRDGSALIAMLWPLQHVDLVRRLADRRITAFSMDAIPRIARAQALDVLSSMSTVAGYQAMLLAAHTVPRFFPMLMTAAGTIPPARVFIIGAGVAGLQAIATARRLGAVVEAFDTRAAVKEQVQSLGAKFVEAELGSADAEDARGYAKALSEEAHRRELELIGGRVKDADVVITTALIPGQRAPLLITGAMVQAMKPGSVIVDLAGEFGGNCELSSPGETVVVHEVTIHAPLNLPATMPVHASQMYSRNIMSFLALLLKDGEMVVNFEDQIIHDACITHEGRIVHERTRAMAESAAT